MSDDSSVGGADSGGMSSSRPYLLRALHAWITDNGLTPYLVVDATAAMVTVPVGHVNEGKIVLNCSYDAVAGLSIENDWVQFSARFAGVSEEISFPPAAVHAIYARENGQGMVFPDEPVETAGEEPQESESAPPKPAPKPGRPSLKVVK